MVPSGKPETLRAERFLHTWEAVMAAVVLLTKVLPSKSVIVGILVIIASIDIPGIIANVCVPNVVANAGTSNIITNVDVSSVIVSLLLVHHKMWTNDSARVSPIMLDPVVMATLHWRISRQSMVSMSVSMVATVAAMTSKAVPNLTMLRFALAEKIILGSTRA